MTAGEVGRRSVASAYTFAVGLGWHLATMVRVLRGRHLVVIDLLAIMASIYLALSVRLDGPLDYDGLAIYLPIALLPLLVRPLVNIRFGLYSRAWGYASVPELTQVIWAMAAGTAICLIIFFGIILPAGIGQPGFPKSFWILELVLSLSMIGGSRFFIRACSDLGTRMVVEGAAVVTDARAPVRRRSGRRPHGSIGQA